MKMLVILFATVLSPLAQTEVHCAGDLLPDLISNPTLVKGRASCFHELVNGSSQLRIIIGEDSHLRWSRLSLLENDTLDFQFVDGASAVLNQFDGSRSVLRGTIMAHGGQLGIISPTGAISLQDSTQIEADSLLLSNHALDDPSAFLRQEPYRLTSNKESRLTVRGNLLTSGDLIVASSGFITTSNARVTSRGGNIGFATGNQLEIRPASSQPVLNRSTNDSVISLNAPLQSRNSIQIDATSRIVLGNALSTTSPGGTIFVRVDNDGLIEAGGSSFPVNGFLNLAGPVDDKVTPVEPNEGDNASSAAPSMSQLPTLKKGIRKTKYTSASVHVRSGRKTTTTKATVARKKSGSSTGKIAMRSSSFFGLRSRSSK
jgi:hypothetical protein